MWHRSAAENSAPNWQQVGRIFSGLHVVRKAACRPRSQLVPTAVLASRSALIRVRSIFRYYASKLNSCWPRERTCDRCPGMGRAVTRRLLLTVDSLLPLDAGAAIPGLVQQDRHRVSGPSNCTAVTQCEVNRRFSDCVQASCVPIL